jgi:PAS domain S-box-containing protein
MTNESNMSELTPDTFFKRLLQSVYDAILITDLNGNIQIANARTEKLLQASADQLCRQNVEKVIGGLGGGVLPRVVVSLEAESHVIIEANCLRNDGTTFPAEIALNKIHLTQPQLCFSIRDITARNEAMEKLQKAQEELVMAEKVKARLDTVTTLAHEINNPLQILLSMVETDRNVRYAAALNRITAVMQELRLDAELKTIDYAGGLKRYAFPGPEVERSATHHMLVVDDEETLAKFFSYLLTTEFPGLNVETASNGAEAIAAFQVKHHAIIIMDIAMPIMNGEQAFQRIRKICKDNSWEMPAVIFCTGYTPPQAVAQAVQEEPLHCYLAKPVTRDTLVTAVKNRLEFFRLSHGESAT